MNEPAPHSPDARPSDAPHEGAAVVPQVAAGASRALWRQPWFWLTLASGLALASSFFLWQKVSGMAEQLARQSAEATAQSIEARTLARQALDQARDAASRQAVLEARLAEVSLQRSQIEELLQTLSRSRDENLIVDIEAAIRLGQQQAELTGSPQPLLAQLKSAEQRLARVAQPRLAPLQRALARDIDRIRSANLPDTPALLVKLDELVRLVDEIPLAADPPPRSQGRAAADAPPLRAEDPLWQRWLARVWQPFQGLVRVSRIAQPEAALLSPEQGFFLRENLKLRIINARLGLLARQHAAARADLAAAADLINRYFDPASKKTQLAATLLQQIQSQMRSAELPRVDETLAALAAAAGATR